MRNVRPRCVLLLLDNFSCAHTTVTHNGFNQNRSRWNVNYEIRGCNVDHAAVTKFRGTFLHYLFSVGESNNWCKDAGALRKQPSRRCCSVWRVLSAHVLTLVDSATPLLEWALAYWMVGTRMLFAAFVYSTLATPEYPLAWNNCTIRPSPLVPV